MTQLAQISGISDSKLSVCRTVSELRAQIQNWRGQKLRIGVVPTMGALHPGHLSLVDAAKKTCDRVIMTIFVNPTQFNRKDDLEKYPRPIEQDLELCRKYGVDAAFVPDAAEIYPNGFNAKIHIGDITARWEGEFRPGHFDGVATVVCKLLNITSPDEAFFGEKDFQQLALIRAMVRDLNIPVQITGCPTLRENDGLAMSSRNLLLKPEHRALAPAFYRILKTMAQKIRDGKDPNAAGVDAMMDLRQSGFEKTDYIAACDAVTLHPLVSYTAGVNARIVGAAWIGGVRLIDNIGIHE